MFHVKRCVQRSLLDRTAALGLGFSTRLRARVPPASDTFFKLVPSAQREDLADRHTSVAESPHTCLWPPAGDRVHLAHIGADCSARV